VICFSRPPNPIAYMYKNMWENGNHYWVNEGRMVHATYDNGMTCIFKQSSQCFIQNKSIIVINLHYISVLKEIIVVSYGGL
jgi:hypothetical protein